MLPASITSGELADLVAGSGSRSAEFPVECCGRLSVLVADSAEARQAKISATLVFDAGPQGRPRVTLRLSGLLQLECQRCLAPFDWRLEEVVQLLVLASEHEAQSSRELVDAVVLGEHGLDVATLLEDEIIAALPLSPRHPDTASCRPDVPLVEGQQARPAPGRPFADLAAMLSRAGRSNETG